MVQHLEAQTKLNVSSWTTSVHLDTQGPVRKSLPVSKGKVLIKIELCVCLCVVRGGGGVKVYIRDH